MCSTIPRIPFMIRRYSLPTWQWILALIGIILRWGFLIWELIFIYCGLFVLIVVVFVLFPLSLRFGQISPLASFRWFTGQRFTWSKTWCDKQQLWKAVITGDTVTRLSIPIPGRGKSPEEGQRWNLAETSWKKKQHKNYQDEDKKSAINKN